MQIFRAIEVRFLREGEYDAEADDHLSITKIAENRLRIKYTERIFGGNNVDLQVLNYSEMYMYMMRLSHMLKIDEDPFRSVQFFIPGYPTALIAISNMEANLPILMNIIMGTCFNWPKIAPISFVGSPEESTNNPSSG